MIKHYLGSAVRQVKRSPLVTTLNVLALALGFVCFAAAIGVSKYWSMSDKHFSRADRIHLVTQQFSEGGTSTGYRPMVAAPIANYLREDFPQLEAVARIGSKREWTVLANDRRALLTGARADADILKIFDFKLIAGDLSQALNTYDQVIITQHAANVLFGDKNPVGQSLRFAEDFAPVVSAVIERPANPSHMSADPNAFGRFDFIYSWPDDSDAREWWLGISAITYVLFPQDSSLLSPKSLRTQLDNFVQRRLPADQAALSHTELDLVPLSGLQSRLVDLQLFEGGSKSLSVEKILAGLGLLVLLVACINYTNLATAQAVSRAKEIGLRKVIGADGIEILKQYWIEALFLTTIAAILAIVGLWLLAPVMYQQSGIDLRTGLFDDGRPALIISCVVVLVAFLSSLYPAIVLTKVSPIDALRQSSGVSGRRLAGRILVSIQFCVASSLLIILLVVNQQNQYLEGRALSDTAEDIVFLTDGGSRGVGFEAVLADLANNPAIVGASDIDFMPWSDHENFLEISHSRDVNDMPHTVFYNQAGYNFAKVFGYELLAGRTFDPERNDFPSSSLFNPEVETSATVPVIVDRALIREMGIASPAEAVGRTLYLSRQFVGTFGQDPAMRIIGVVENMPLVLAASGKSANIYGRSDNSFGYPAFRIRSSATADTLAAIRASVESRDPTALVSFRFMEEAFANGFRTFRGITAAFYVLSIIAMLISFMGLVGMIAFSLVKRRHEVGIRKTLGASSFEVVVMFLKDFSWPVIVGNFLAWPIAYMGASAYMENFIERVDLTIFPWVLGFVVATLLAWTVVATQSFSAARVKPSEVLRYE